MDTRVGTIRVLLHQKSCCLLCSRTVLRCRYVLYLPRSMSCLVLYSCTAASRRLPHGFNDLHCWLVLRRRTAPESTRSIDLSCVEIFANRRETKPSRIRAGLARVSASFSSATRLATSPKCSASRCDLSNHCYIYIYLACRHRIKSTHASFCVRH